MWIGYVLSILGLAIMVYSFQNDINNKLTVPPEKIGWIDFYDHRDGEIYHVKVLTIGQDGLKSLNTRNKTSDKKPEDMSK